MKNKLPFLLLSCLFIAALLSACGLPGSADQNPPANQSALPTAVYNPGPSETPATPLWASTQPVCDGKPLYLWRVAGTFTWHFSSPDYDDVSTISQNQAQYTLPGDGDCGYLPVGLGEIMKDTPAAGAKTQWTGSCKTTVAGAAKTIVQQVSITVSGWEQKNTKLGTFQALRVKSTNQYIDGTTPGVIDVNDWYVCGYGRIYSESTDTSTDTNYKDELLSFTPQSTDEARVRYILADIQLMNSAAAYHANSDEETAEALRRWQAGIRVINMSQFSRKLVNGQWQIVYAGSEKQVKGGDIKLSSDPSQ